METKGKIVFVRGREIMLDVDSLEGVEQFTPEDIIKITIKRYHPPRSITANNYLWAITGKLAETLNLPMDEIHAEHIRKYSTPIRDEQGRVKPVFLLADVTPAPSDYLYFVKDIDINGNQYKAYLELKGTHSMDSKEFSRFLDLVIEECHEHGVDTMTPQELAELEGYIAK